MIFVKRGSVTTTDKKIGTEFYQVTEDVYKSGDRGALLDSPVAVYAGVGKGLQAGAVISIDAGEKDGSVLPRTEKFLGLWPDIELRATWSVQERAFQAELDARRRRETEGKADPIEQLLAPVHRVYRTLPAPARAQMLARIIYYLGRP